MNPTPEQYLQRSRLAQPSPDLRARSLAAARKEWNRPVPLSAWQTFRRPLLAVAASLVLVVAGSWINHRLTASATVAAVCPVQAPPAPALELAGLPLPPSLRLSANPIITAAALQARQLQMRELLETPFSPAATPAPNGQTQQFRQNTSRTTSCC